jgi:hypothetical protein
MPARTEDVMAVRQEMWTLLRKQLETLNSPDGLNDDQLLSCYYRQTRVQELREKLEAVSNNVADSNLHEMCAERASDSLIIAA